MDIWLLYDNSNDKVLEASTSKRRLMHYADRMYRDYYRCRAFKWVESTVSDDTIYGVDKDTDDVVVELIKKVSL